MNQGVAPLSTEHASILAMFLFVAVEYVIWRMDLMLVQVENIVTARRRFLREEDISERETETWPSSADLVESLPLVIMVLQVMMRVELDQLHLV